MNSVDDVEEVALALRQAGLEHMRAVDPPRHPFLHHEALEIGRVVAQVDRRDLDGDHVLGLDVDGQIDVAAAGAVQFPDDPVAVEHRRASSSGGSGSSCGWPNTSLAAPSGGSSTRTIWTVRLSSLPARGPVDNGLRGCVEIGAAFVHRLCNATGVRVSRRCRRSRAQRRRPARAAASGSRSRFADLRRAPGRDSSASEETTIRWSIVELLQRVAGETIDAGNRRCERDAPWSN